MTDCCLRVLDLFSGIGGFSLGLERTGGFRTIAFCENEDFPRRVLRKHWPEVPIYDDVRELTAVRLAGDGIHPDVICGGFPCQDISKAGPGGGLDGERSGLWREYARLIGEIRPRFVIVENVAALLGRGLGAVLGDLAALGYDAEWHCIPASAVGAPHRRDRLWIVAYPNGFARDEGRQGDATQGSRGRNADRGRQCQDVADADGERALQPEGREREQRRRACNGGAHVAHTGRPRLPLSQQAGRGISLEAARNEWGPASECGWWAAEPDVGRMAHGVPARVDRLRCLGNAVVPQIPEMIGRAIIQATALSVDTPAMEEANG